MASTASNSASILATSLAMPSSPTITTLALIPDPTVTAVALIPDTTVPLQTKSRKSTPSSSKIKIPRTSPFKIYSAEEENRATALDDSFVDLFEKKCRISQKVPGNFKALFPVDIWREILDHVDSPQDLFALCRTSSNLYHLAIPHLYRTIIIRSPFYHGEPNLDGQAEAYSPHNLIPFDVIIPPITPIAPVGARAPTEAAALVEMRARFKNAKRVRPSNPEEKWLFKPLLFEKWQLVHFVKDLKIEKWEGRGNSSEPAKPPGSGYAYPRYKRGEKQIVSQTNFSPEGVIDLRWMRCEVRKSFRVQKILAGLLGGMPMLESFTYNPQRYLSAPDTEPPSNPLGVLLPPILPNPPGVPQPPERPGFWINGVTPGLFAALKILPHLKSLTINFLLWDPLSLAVKVFLLAPLRYKPEKAGLVGFKNLEELVILGVSADKRFSEVEIVVKDCLLSSLERRLKRLEVRIEGFWYDELQELDMINPTQDLWDWAVALWGRCFGAAESFRCARGLNSTHIDFLLEFGPIRWQWQCPANTGFICRSENLTTVNLRDVHPKQILGAIKRLAKMGTPSLKVFAVECRLLALNRLLKRFSGLQELYIFEPEAQAYDVARDLHWADRELSLNTPEVGQQKPIGHKGTQWTLDTICKHHLRTLKVLVIEEMISPPRLNCPGATLNAIGGWRERGANLRELGVCLWGTWKEIGEFITAFEGLRALHLFNRQRCDTAIAFEGVPKYLQTVPLELSKEQKSFFNAETMALKIANLWGRDLICSRKKSKVGMLDEDRWIGMGPHFNAETSNWRWRWRIDSAERYVNWEDGPEFVGGKVKRMWEEGGRMWKVLEEGGVLTRDDLM